MALDFATSYAEIIKFNKNDDGTITVYGKATSDDLDIDQQICDNDWLSKAMPEWFKSGGNIREQHSSIAAGVAHELETKDDGYYVSAHIVDPTSIKKVEAKVLKGFSIGIKGPRVVRDNKAANGRIIDGQIVEVSLVDRPANPTCQLVLAKSVGGESTLTQVEDLIEKYNPDQERDERGRFGSGGGGSNNDQPVGRDAKTAINRQKNEIQNARMKTVKDEYTAQGHKDVQSAERYLARAGKAETVGQATQLIGQARTAIDRAIGVFEDQNYHDTAGTLYNAGKELNSLSVGMGTGVIKSASVALQYNFTNKSDKDYETMKNALLESIVEMEKSVAGDKVKFDQASYDVARRGIAQLIISEAGEIAETDSDERDDIGTLLSALKHLFNFRDGELDEDQDAVSDMAGSIESAEGEEVVAEDKPAEEKADELVDAELPTSTEILDEKSVSAIIEKAVKSATDTVKAEIAEYEAASKAANEKVMVLESELVAAKSAAIASGPKRTGRIAVTDTNELLLKAAEYRLKASATSDQILAKGYKALEKEYLEKAGTPKAE